MPGDVRGEAVAALNGWSADEARRALTACCASRRWVDALADARPYAGWAELATAASAGISGLRWPDVLEALEAHPRIGDRAAGESREARWSRAEQSAAASGEAAVLEALARANVEYEERFGHVFLICASGRPAEQILAEARRRSGNEPVAEHDEVRRELAGIVLLRLERLGAGAGPATSAAPDARATVAAGAAPKTNARATAGVATGGQDKAESPSVATEVPE